MFNDLREFISEVEKLGECKIVEGADWNLEIGVISEIESMRANPSMLLFDKIKGHEAGFRVVSNLFSSKRLTALALGLPATGSGVEIVRAMRDKLKQSGKLIPPVEVETGPVKENILTGDDVDLLKFPAPKWHELDGGKYISTGGMIIMRDPDEGWVNLGCYRVQVHDKSTVTVAINQGNHGWVIMRKYWDKGLACPVAISCGQAPILWFSAFLPISWGVCEYDYAGSLNGKPFEITRGVTTDLPIPARAEAVLEGEMVPPEVETRIEGPFGEFTGYYGLGPHPEPAVRIKSILYRNNPIFQGNPPMRTLSGAGFTTQVLRSAALWDELDKQVPGVCGVWQLENAGALSMNVISLKQQYAGHAKQAALVAAGAKIAALFERYIIVVDEDIDPSNLSEVIWALGTRSEPEAIDIIRGGWSAELNPTLSPEQRKRGECGHSMAIILACKPYHWKDEFPKSVASSPELIRKTKEKWAKLFQ